MEKKGWYSCQILFSFFLILVGLYVIFNSVRYSMPLIKAGDATYVDAPGFSPVVCGGLLIILSLYVAYGSWKRGGTLRYFFSAEMFAALKSKEALTFYKVFTLMFLYGFVLLPSLPYWLSTILFMLAFMITFKYFTWKAVAVSVLTSFTLYYVFGTLFSVALP